MTLRSESERIGYALAALGIAFAGNLAALLTLPLIGYYSGLPLVLIAGYMGFVPAILVGLFAVLLPRLGGERLHPVPISLAAFVGGMLAFPLYYPFGTLGLLFLAGLLAYVAAELSRFGLDRPDLRGREVALHGLVALLAFALFIGYPLSRAVRWVVLPGCEECDPTANAMTATVMSALALSIILGAALRFRRPGHRLRGPLSLGGSGP